MREYKTRDAKDLLEKEYPFDDTNEWGSWYKDFKLKIISFFEGRPRKRFVAYSMKEKKAIGTVKIDKITKNLWHSGGWFVSTSHRRKGIATLLIKTAYDYQKRIGVTKVVANVEVANFSSIRTAVKNGGRFIPQSYYQCDGEISNKSVFFEIKRKDEIKFVNIRHHDLDKLYNIFRKCTCEEWPNFLEIDKDNFLERFFGYTRMSGPFKLWIKNRIVVIEEKGDILGYFYYTLPVRRRKRVRVHLFLLSFKRTINLIGKLINLLKNDGYEKVSLVFTHKNRAFMEEIANILQNHFQFKKKKFLISTRFLE